MSEIRCRKTINSKRNLNTKWLLLQNLKNLNFLHSNDVYSTLHTWSQTTEKHQFVDLTMELDIFSSRSLFVIYIFSMITNMNVLLLILLAWRMAWIWRRGSRWRRWRGWRWGGRRNWCRRIRRNGTIIRWWWRRKGKRWFLKGLFLDFNMIFLCHQ